MPRNPDCKKCKLGSGPKTICLWGQGRKTKPLVMFIGEAPGEKEDETGIPFHHQAPAGSILRELIEEMEIEKNCYITNVVKCRPPDNRTPKKPEVDACAEYLHQEIKRVKPQIIVLLGATAIKALGGYRHVSVAHARMNKSWNHNGIPIIATYHPASCLAGRNPENFDLLVDDLNRICNREFIAPEELKWKQVESTTSPAAFARMPKTMAFDLETSQISPFGSNATILCAAWSGSGNRASVSSSIARLLEALSEATPTLVCHNAKFELLWLRKYGYIHKGPVHDTMIMAHLLDENQPKSLKYLAGLHTGYGDYANRLKIPTNVSSAWKEHSADVMQYCAYDAAATWKLYKVLWKRLRQEGLLQLYAAQIEVMKTLVEMEWNGVKIGAPETEALRRHFTAELKKKERSLHRVLGDINLNSTPQLSNALFGKDGLGLKPSSRTKSGLGSTNEESLLKVKEKAKPKEQRVIDNLLERRSLKKQLSTYVEGVWKLRDSDGFVHTSYNITGTVTGRLSSSAPNLQNIPRESNSPIKSIFAAREGMTMIAADYAQMELRIGAYLTRDATMLRLLRSGADLHTETARQIMGHAPSPEERVIAKAVNFGIFYGMGPGGLSKETELNFKEARDFIRGWHITYPAVLPWQQEQEELLLHRGYVESAFGRRRRLELIIDGDQKEYQHTVRQACNHPVQSTAAEITLLAMVRIKQALYKQGLITLNVHDSVIVEVPDPKVKSIIRSVRSIMEDASGVAQSFGFDMKFDVPTPVEIKVGKSWVAMEEV